MIALERHIMIDKELLQAQCSSCKKSKTILNWWFLFHLQERPTEGKRSADEADSRKQTKSHQVYNVGPDTSS
jgi:hypothetical protein